MGWCSGTDIFERTAKVVIDPANNVPAEAQYNILLALADEMEKHDWDCQYDLPDSLIDVPVIRRVFVDLGHLDI